MSLTAVLSPPAAKVAREVVIDEGGKTYVGIGEIRTGQTRIPLICRDQAAPANRI